MPFFDRHWWLLGLLTAFLIVGMVALTFLQVLSTISLVGRLDVSTFPWWSLIGFLLVLLLVVSSLVPATVAARRHAADRRAAIAGAFDRMPAAAIRVDARWAVDLTQEPLTIGWRLSRGRRFGVSVFLLAYGAILLTLPYLPVFPYPMDLLSPPFPSAPDVLRALDSPFGIMGVFSVLLALGVLLHGLITRGRPPRPRVTFSPTDVREQPRFGRQRTLAWEEARLLEVRFAPHPFRQYILYGARGRFVRWVDYLPNRSSTVLERSALMPDGTTQDEMAARLRGALDTVAARTGLTPRTFETTLQAQTSAARQRRLGRIGTALAILLGVVVLAPLTLAVLGFPLGVGVYALLRHPVSDQLSNLVCGVSLAAGGALLLLWFAGWLAVRLIRIRRSPPASPPVSSSDPAEASTMAQEGELYLPQPWHEAVLTVLIPLLLLCGGVSGVLGGVLSLSATPLAPSPGTDVIAPLPFDLIWFLILVGFVGIIGAGTLLARLRSGVRGAKRIWADEQGVHVAERRRTLHLPWEQVDSLRVQLLRNRPVGYTATGDTGRVSIEWGTYDHAETPRSGRAPLTAAALAAVIERRAGIARVTVDAFGRQTRPPAEPPQ